MALGGEASEHLALKGHWDLIAGAQLKILGERYSTLWKVYTENKTQRNKTYAKDLCSENYDTDERIQRQHKQM